jgi:hypothetical protein
MDEFIAWQKVLYEWNKVQRMKRLNQRLYDQLGGSIIHIMNYAKENDIPLPNKDKLYDLVDKAELIINDINKLSDENLQSNKDDENRRRLDRTFLHLPYILHISEFALTLPALLI